MKDFKYEDAGKWLCENAKKMDDYIAKYEGNAYKQ
jgi:hypothetical protein